MSAPAAPSFNEAEVTADLEQMQRVTAHLPQGAAIACFAGYGLALTLESKEVASRATLAFVLEQAVRGVPRAYPSHGADARHLVGELVALLRGEHRREASYAPE